MGSLLAGRQAGRPWCPGCAALTAQPLGAALGCARLLRSPTVNHPWRAMQVRAMPGQNGAGGGGRNTSNVQPAHGHPEPIKSTRGRGRQSRGGGRAAEAHAFRLRCRRPTAEVRIYVTEDPTAINNGISLPPRRATHSCELWASRAKWRGPKWGPRDMGTHFLGTRPGPDPAKARPPGPCTQPSRTGGAIVRRHPRPAGSGTTLSRAALLVSACHIVTSWAANLAIPEDGGRSFQREGLRRPSTAASSARVSVVLAALRAILPRESQRGARQAGWQEDRVSRGKTRTAKRRTLPFQEAPHSEKCTCRPRGKGGGPADANTTE